MKNYRSGSDNTSPYLTVMIYVKRLILVCTILHVFKGIYGLYRAIQYCSSILVYIVRVILLAFATPALNLH